METEMLMNKQSAEQEITYNHALWEMVHSNININSWPG